MLKLTASWSLCLVTNSMIALVSGSEPGLCPINVSTQLSLDPSNQVRLVTFSPHAAGKFLFRSVPLHRPNVLSRRLGLLPLFFLHIRLLEWEISYLKQTKGPN